MESLGCDGSDGCGAELAPALSTSLSGVSLPFCEGGFLLAGEVFDLLDNPLVITKTPLRGIPQSRSASSGVNTPSDGIG